ncbi:MAG: GDP-L-fucose synthase [Proteobacteria bacterium]|nr:GDP-L-fucose synthase [Pseudomonadota bacterium]
MEQNSKIYVAGHGGLVGSAILRKLKAEGHTNIITRSRSELDLTRQEKVEEFFDKQRPEYVFLAAAKVGGIWANNIYRADFMYSNLAVETNIIHASYLCRVKKLLFLGSSCIYPRDCPQPMKEQYLLSGYLEPTNEAYAVAKIAGIKMCQSYNHQHGTRNISVMPTNLYGPKDNFDLETSHAMPALIRKVHLAKLAAEGHWDDIQKDEKFFGPIPDVIKKSFGINPSTNQPLNESTTQPKIILWGTGNARREFLYVDDLADACLYLMDTYESGDIINVGAGKDLTVRELAELIARVVGFKGRMTYDPSKPDGTPRKLLDVSRLQSLGWQPKITLEDGIRKTYEWYVNNVGKDPKRQDQQNQ